MRKIVMALDQAIEILSGAEAILMAAGGLGEAADALTPVIEGSHDQVEGKK